MAEITQIKLGKEIFDIKDESAASAGYGYGEAAILLQSERVDDEAELEAVLKPVYDAMNARETKLVYWQGFPASGTSTHGWFGILTKSSANNGSVVAWSAYDKGYMIRKVKYSGTWQPHTRYTTTDDITLNNLGAAAASHSHTKSQITDFPTSIPPSDHNHAASDITSGTLSVSRGGTGKSTLTSGSFLKGNGTNAVTLRTPAQVLSDIGAAASSHTHDYAASSHTHDYAPSSHTHDYITYKDTRSENQTPDALQAGVTVHLKTNGTDGLSDGGSYHPILSVKDWSDYSGGPYSQYTTTANQNMWFRASTSGSAWGSWKKVVDSTNVGDYAPSKTGSGASGTWGINVTGSAGSVAWGNVSGKPSSYTPSSHSHTPASIGAAPSSHGNHLNWHDVSFTTSGTNVTTVTVSGTILAVLINFRGQSSEWNQDIVYVPTSNRHAPFYCYGMINNGVEDWPMQLYWYSASSIGIGRYQGYSGQMICYVRVLYV